MSCLAGILGFLCLLQVPDEETCLEVVTDYLYEEVSFSSPLKLEELNSAKEHLKEELFKHAWNPTLSDIERAVFERSKGVLEQLSLEAVNDALTFREEVGDRKLFFALPLSKEEEKTIHKIITTLAENNVFSLLFARSELERKGKQIEMVHPMRFLGSIFSSHQLRSGMHDIKKNSFKWDGFMAGLERRMKEESHKDNLMRYVPGFAAHVHADPHKVAYYVRHRNWEGLLRYLM